MSYRQVRTLGDAIDHGVLLRITCANALCGRVRRVAPIALLGRFPANAGFAAIGERMVCRGADLVGGGCGHRGALVTFSLPDPPEPDQPPPGGGNVVPFTARRFTADQPTTAKPRRRVAGGRRRAKKRSHLRLADRRRRKAARR